MKKILFITNRDVLTSCGALRLIKNRAESLYHDYNIVTDFCVLQRQSRIESPKREKIDAGGRMWIVGYKVNNILSSLSNFYKKVYEQLSVENYDAIIISQAVLKLNIKKIRKFTNAPIFLDVHGSSEDIYESVRGGSKIQFVLRKLAYYLDKCIIRYYLEHIDGCFVVSSGLIDYLNRMTTNKNLKFFRAPCAVVNRDDGLDYEKCRKEYKDKFNVQEDTLCFVYSGGIEPWQSVEETIDIFKSIADSISRKCKMFIFSYEVELVKQMVIGDNRFYVGSFKTDELKKALCAMDYAFLIRKDTVTNNVAYPNKFLEYLQARLKVISTPYVYDIAKQIEKYDVGFIYKFDDNINGLVEYVKNHCKVNLQKDLVDCIIDDNSFKTRLAEFVGYINKDE